MSYQREYEKKIKAAVIGVGSHCYRNILPTMTWLPVELIAVCDVNEKLAQYTAQQYGCKYYVDTEEMYQKESELEAVFICVGPKQHPALAAQALKNGKHVWLEKPVSVRASQVQALIDMKADTIVVTGLKKMFTPAAKKAREIIADRNYGGLNSILAIYPMMMPSDGKSILDAGDTPNWLRNGVHPLSFLTGVAGEVSEVQTLANEKGYGVVTLKFKNGVFGTLHLASGPPPSAEQYSLFGDTWQMDVVSSKVSLRRGIQNFNYERTIDYISPSDQGGSVVWDLNQCLATLENKEEFVQGIYQELKYFCDCVLANRKPELGTLQQALEIMKIYEAALCSDGSPIKISD